MGANKKEDAQKALAQLFESLDIKKIICIDDEYALPHGSEEAIGLIDRLGPEKANAILNNKVIRIHEERDIWVGPFGEWWAELSHNQRRLELYKLRSAAGEGKANETQDLFSAGSLAELFVGHDFRELSFSQWNDQKEDLLREARQTRTLFLFDEDLTRDGGTTTGGIELIRQVMASDEAQSAMCALLSHKILPDKEFEYFKEFTEQEYGFDPDRVVPVAKANLGRRPLDFARSIKLTVLNPDCRKLVRLSINMMKESNDRACKRLEDIGIHAFDHMVFRASNRDGIWEPDTLFRLLNLFQRLEARAAALKNPELRQLVEKIRSVSNIPTQIDPKSRPDDAWKTQQLELYETADFINSSHLPIELGDIFERTGENPDESTKYILLAQPCDLMVRPEEGSRKEAIDRVVLARIADKAPSDRESEYDVLPQFNCAKDEDAIVDFTEVHLVSLNTLDLCSFDSEGIARISLADEPDHLVAAWQKHHKAVLDYYERLIKNRGQVGQAISSFNEGKQGEAQIQQLVLDSLSTEFSRPPLFSATINIETKTVKFNCKRIGRFEQHHAAAMWTKFCNYASRPAFDVDLGK